MGTFESVNKEEIRCDSPTSEPESHLVLCSYAATRKLRLRTADITNAYFQAAPMMRLLLMAPPRGGLTMFDAEIPEDAVLMCRVPVYGTKDAARGFSLWMNAEILARGFVASQICPATYYLFGKDQHLAAMMCTHVDDLLFAYSDEGKETVDAILNRFSGGKIEEGSFRYCGRRFSQDDDCTIHVDVRDNTRTLKPAAIGKDRKMNDPLTQEELTSLRRVVGGLAWVSCYGRPDLTYRVNELQRCCHSKSTVQSLKDANRIVELALQGSDFKITFKTDWIDWNDLAVVTFSDASFANEAEVKSQQGRIHYITSLHRNRVACLIFVYSTAHSHQ